MGDFVEPAARGAMSRSGRMRRIGMLAAIGLGLALPAQAQDAGDIAQAVANQNTILRRFTPPPRTGSIDIEVQDQRGQVPIEAAREIRFMLRSLTVVGADTVPLTDLVMIWRDRIGEVISLADLYEIAEAIDAAYLRAGYFSMAVVPVQDYASGQVSIRVYESYVQDLELTSSIPDVERRLAPYINRILSMRPIRVKEAERILLLMSDLAGVTIEGTFVKPDTPQAGGGLILNIDFERTSGFVAFDNLGSSNFGPLELSATMTLNDLMGRMDATNIVGVTVPDDPRELALAQVSQDIPIGHDGLFTGYALTYIARRPGGDLADLDIDLRTALGAAYVSYPFLRTRARSLFGRLEFSAQNDEVELGGLTVEQTRSRWLLASLRLEQDFAQSTLTGTAALGQGIGLGASNAPWIPEDYRFARLDFDFNHNLTEAVSLRVRGAGQYAADSLPSPAQMDLGGDPYGWAFDGASASGDSGLATAIEIRRGFDVASPIVSNFSAAIFADYGVVWNRSSFEDYSRATLGSVGVGADAIIGERLNAQVVVATPWDASEALDEPGSGVFFRLILPF